MDYHLLLPIMILIISNKIWIIIIKLNNPQNKFSIIIFINCNLESIK